MTGSAVADAKVGRGWLVAVCWLSLTAAGCGMPVPERGSGPGGRQQPLALSPEQELEVGREAYRKVLEEYRDRLVPADDPQVIRVRHAVSRLIKAARIEPLQREINLRQMSLGQGVHGYYFEWEVNVVREKQVNAFCLPAGKIILFTGVMQVARDDDELATVLSHEISHALAHHASEKIARKRTEGGGGILRSLSYDRMQEAEADHIGVFLMAFAGYDPAAAVRFWQEMSRLHRGGARPEILSDHPSDENRIRNLEQWAPKAQEAKRAYDEGRIAPAASR